MMEERAISQDALKFRISKIYKRRKERMWKLSKP